MNKPKPRKPKENDEAMLEKARTLILELFAQNKDIEGTIWHAVLISLFIHMYAQSGFTYGLFCKEMERIKETFQGYFLKK